MEKMHHLPDLAALSRAVVKMLNWLETNYVRLVRDLREQCPEQSDEWIAAQIFDAAFSHLS